MSTAQRHAYPAPPAPTHIVIAADGDAILRVERVEIQVDSRKLRLHSAEFNRFFDRSGNARGLQGASAAEPYPMLLSEGSPEAMEMICRLLHDQEDPLATCSSAAKFSEFSRLAAKYECVANAKSAAEGHWPSFNYSSASDASSATLHSLVQAAWYLDHGAQFKQLTGYWIANRRELDGARASSGMLTIVEEAMQEVTGLGAEGQTDLQQVITEFINTICELEADVDEHDAIRAFDSPSGQRLKCTYARDVRDVCFEQLKRAKIWPRNKQSEHADQLCDAIQLFLPFPGDVSLPSPCDHYKCRRSMQEEVGVAVRTMGRAAQPTFEGLCLQCCKLGGKYKCIC